jgi:type II secretory pathway pseudopilin PulG
VAVSERGTVLLEVLVALTLLLLSGVTVLSLLSASLRSATVLAERESTLRAADRVLAGLSLLSRTDLDRRLGQHPAGRFVAEVRRPEPSLYRIALWESDTAAVELLVTVVYRPDGRTP